MTFLIAALVLIPAATAMYAINLILLLAPAPTPLPAVARRYNSVISAVLRYLLTSATGIYIRISAACYVRMYADPTGFT